MADVDSIRVRMYRHGFGDCFLLQFFAAKKRKASMLIDCGLKRNDSVAGVSIQQVASDIKKELRKGSSSKKPRLDYLVVTHEHWDHVSGFRPEAKLFNDVEIEKIWLAWTEDPDDPEAQQINSSIIERVKAIKLATDRVAEGNKKNAAFYKSVNPAKDVLGYRKKYHSSLEEILTFFGSLSVTKTSTSNIKYKDQYRISVETQRAMDHVRGLAKKGKSGITYFNPGEVFTDATRLPGVRIYILGPPKSALLNKDKPSSGGKKEVYFGFKDTSFAGFVKGLLHDASTDSASFDDGRPFGQVPCVDEVNANQEYYWKKTYYASDERWRTIEDDWLDGAGALALQMDSDTNNTSLVLAIQLIDSQKVLLFSGDAQVGSWLSWHSLSWEAPGGGAQKVDAKHLLGQTVFYKVGHHASHNATLKDQGLELMKHKDLVAFVPEKEKQYNGIPYGPLMRELKQKTKSRLIVSADKNHKPEDVIKKKPEGLSATEWNAFKKNLKIRKVFVEYIIKA
jgi:hypothetical protein